MIKLFLDHFRNQIQEMEVGKGPSIDLPTLSWPTFCLTRSLRIQKTSKDNLSCMRERYVLSKGALDEGLTMKATVYIMKIYNITVETYCSN